MPRTPIAVLVGALAIAAGPASPPLFAQSQVTLTPPDVYRWDTAAYTGWYGAARAGAESWDNWTATGFGGGSASYGWTRHLRTEVDVSFTGRGSVYASSAVLVPGQPTPIVRPEQRRYRDTTVAVSLLYDPLENRWVHPFIGVGVGIVREHLRIELPDWIYYGRPPGGIPVSGQPAQTDITYRATPHVVGGARFYVAERAFIRTDLRVGVAGDDQSAQLRIGVGVDF